MKNFKRLIVLLLMFNSISVWANSEVEKVTYREMLSLNAQNINHVKNGMAISSVVSLMKNYQSEVKDGTLSNPWRIESKGNTDIYHYLTRGHPPFTPILEQQAIPVIFINGKVSAVGREYLRNARNNAISSESSKPTNKGTLEERLKILKYLYENGVIDQQTYKAQQQRILDGL